MTRPRVSVIVPCHNGGRFLDGLLGSLAAQSFGDFETIVVNNGSTEAASLAKLAEIDGAVRVVHQENRYLPGARNTGFRRATGALVLPLDCDDRLEPSFLAKTVAALAAAPADVGFVFTHMRLVGAVEGVVPRRFEPFDQLFLNRLPYCMLIRKSAWAAAGGYDETMRDGVEDWEFNIRLARAGYRGQEIAEPLFIYAVRADGMLMSKSARMQGTIWRNIRQRHREAYRLPALLRLWRADGARLSSALKAAGLFALARLLPEAWFNAAFFRLFVLVRAWRVRRGDFREAAPGCEAAAASD